MSKLSVVLLALSLVGACRLNEPPGRPESTCNKACNERASARCSEDDCERGCRFILDRLVEHEGNRVIDCIARAESKVACTDDAWADCAARVGVHADGGPPAPVHSPEE